MEPLPSGVVGQGDKFGEFLDRRIKSEDEGKDADRNSLGDPHQHWGHLFGAFTDGSSHITQRCISSAGNTNQP